jgi:hypothetical protein
MFTCPRGVRRLQLAPDAYEAVFALGRAAKAGIDKQLLELIELRASEASYDEAEGDENAVMSIDAATRRSTLKRTFPVRELPSAGGVPTRPRARFGASRRACRCQHQ